MDDASVDVSGFARDSLAKIGPPCGALSTAASCPAR